MRRPTRIASARLPQLLVVLAFVACSNDMLEPLSAPETALDRALMRLRDVEATERPWVAGGFVYYTRVDAQGTRLHCRRGIEPGAPEQVLLTAPSSSLGAFDVSPDQRWLAFSTRGEGDRYRLQLKDLASGDVTAPIEGTDFAVAWAPDSTLFYAGLDDKDRPTKVYAVKPSTGGAKKVAPRLVHEEKSPAREVMVAPIDDGAALFVRDLDTAPRRLLGFRLGGARLLEGLPQGVVSEPTPTDPPLGGAGLVEPPPARPAVR